MPFRGPEQVRQRSRHLLGLLYHFKQELPVLPSHDGGLHLVRALDCFEWILVSLYLASISVLDHCDVLLILLNKLLVCVYYLINDAVVCDLARENELLKEQLHLGRCQINVFNGDFLSESLAHHVGVDLVVPGFQ